MYVCFYKLQNPAVNLRSTLPVFHSLERAQFVLSTRISTSFGQTGPLSVYSSSVANWSAFWPYPTPYIDRLLLLVVSPDGIEKTVDKQRINRD